MAGLRLEVHCGSTLEPGSIARCGKDRSESLSNALKFTLQGSISVTLQDTGEH
jgi:hypothetical protein